MLGTSTARPGFAMQAPPASLVVLALCAACVLALDPVAADNRTFTVVLGTPVGPHTDFAVQLGNVVNAASVGTYAIPSVTSLRQGTTNQTVDISGETYDIFAAPLLSMTVTAPDAGQTVDFGTIDPGAATRRDR